MSAAKFVRNGSDSNYSKYGSRLRETSESETNKSSIEWKIGVCGLLFGIAVILAKLSYAHRDDLYNAFVERKLVSFETITEDGQKMFNYAWKSAIRHSSLWLPILCGFLTTYFTGLIVYLDSNVPGVQPPSPFSPTKYRERSGHTFHINYVLAIVMGILVTCYMFWRKISLEF